MVDTVTIDLVSNQWTEILGNNTWIKMQIKTAGGVFLHMNGSTPPPLNAPAFLVESFQPVFDIQLDGLPANANIWAKSQLPTASVTVMRRSS